MEDHGYIEIETPVLLDKPSGATARPFISHHNVTAHTGGKEYQRIGFISSYAPD